MRARHTIVLLALMLGCSGKESGDGSTGGDTGPADTNGTSDTPSDGLSGTYKGYIESFKFPDGSDTVVMNLAFASGGTLSGTVVFGDATPLAPPTDPNVGYPPSYVAEPGMPPSGGPIEGFAYTVLSGAVAGPRVTLQVQHTEVWKKWCELQTTIYPQYNGASDGSCGALLGYGCLPNVAFSGSPSGCTWSSCDHPTDTPVDCTKLTLCGLAGVCKCTSTACTVPVGPAGDISFDMQLSGGALNGSTTGISGSVLNVHLTRQ